MFFRDIPEAALLFDIDQMVKDGQDFDYSTISPEILKRSWVPSYCRPRLGAGDGLRRGGGLG